ncbi:hypothetical protein K474DRAFT_1770210 [Panus rudis PR-1116 ss-1]|nr:hypothetical protein K474DRAFT_1770210 [Panus rudis PR-1116 ss-1]
MPIARLPEEIQDYIVDFLHDDKASLKACSLVAKSWTLKARVHLFYDISIRWTVERSEDNSTLVSMLAYFQNSPLQARYVGIFRIYGGYLGRAPDDWGLQAPLIDIEYNAHGFRTIYSLAALLVNLKMIAFIDCSDLTSSRLPSLALFDSPAVPTLKFVACTDLFISQILIFFPRTERVIMDLVGTGDDEQWYEMEQRDASQLGSLEGILADYRELPGSGLSVIPRRMSLKSICIGYILEAGARVPKIMWHLLDTTPTGTLTSLDITEQLLEPIELTAFWRKIGTNLVHLRLSDDMLLYNYNRTDLEGHWRSFLPPLRRLLTFTIYTITHCVSSDDATPVGTFLALKHAPSTLQAIVIDDRENSLHTMSRWTSLRLVLIRFTQLKYFGLTGSVHSSQQALQDLCGLLHELSSENKVRLLDLADSEHWNDFQDLSMLLNA